MRPPSKACKRKHSKYTFVKFYADLIYQTSRNICNGRCPFEHGGNGHNPEILEENIPFIFKAMLDAMTDDEVKQFNIFRHDQIYPFDDILKRRIKGKSKHYAEKNLSIATLLKYYTTPCSGKKDFAGKQLKKRYDAQSYNNQKRILSAFLESNMTDRKWACIRLYRDWDPYFTSRIKKAWHAHYDQSLAYVIVKHFPASFIQKELNEIKGLVDYWAICVRLGNNTSFKIDWNKLPLDEELYVRSELGMKDEKNLENKFFMFLSEKCEQCAHYFFLKSSGASDEEWMNYIDKKDDIVEWAIQDWHVAFLEHLPKYYPMIRSIAKLGMKNTLCKMTMIMNELYNELGSFKERQKDEDRYKVKALSLMAKHLRDQIRYNTRNNQ